PRDQHRVLGRIREIAPRSAPELVLQSPRRTDGVGPIWDLQDRQRVAISRKLVIVRTRMVWLLRGSAPVIVAERVAPPRYGPLVGHAGKRRQIDLHAELGEYPHRHVVVVCPSRLRRPHRKSSRQRTEALLQASSDPVFV